MSKIILASGSPRRKILLEQLGLSFDIIVSNTDEVIDPMLSPSELVIQLSKQKAADVAKNLEGDFVVLGADTIVVYKDKVLGKPKDREEAKAMLTMLQGNMHEVYTGITLIQTKNHLIKVGYERTEVYMRPLSSSIIDAYTNTREPMDKAGAYGIQGVGAVLIDKVCGDYNNVVGLPLKLLSILLKEMDVDIFENYTFPR
ncbi:Maf family protein [Defluviitalea raffinosedens]|uniref:Maf family protein n=1 Tax=Defluviitalea raffinosedens TaxID=1450156 RepID=UPI00195E33FD|nr:Maf family protein [Defluviitalea raffinosedens]MBM7685615.1 septum formation protein [Defluviitalea raffinosedens]